MKTLQFTLTLAVLAAVSSEGQVALDTSGRHGSVRLVVVDPFGNSIEDAKVTIAPVKESHLLEPAKGALQMTLLYGAYRVLIEKSGFASASRGISVEHPEAIIVIALPIADIEASSEPTVVSGRFNRPVAAQGCDTVRMIPLVLSTAPIDASIFTDGTFYFEGLKAGEYVAVVLGSSGICKVSQVTLQHRSNQNIVLR